MAARNSPAAKVKKLNPDNVPATVPNGGMRSAGLVGRVLPGGVGQARGEAPMLDRPLKPESRAVVERDLGGEHLDQDLTGHPVELPDDALDLGPDPRVGRDDDRVRHLVGDEASLPGQAAPFLEEARAPTGAACRAGCAGSGIPRCSTGSASPATPASPASSAGSSDWWCSWRKRSIPTRARRWRRAWPRGPSPWCSRRSRRRRAARRRCPRRASRRGGRCVSISCLRA